MIFKVQRQNGAINGGKTTCLIYSRQCSRIQEIVRSFNGYIRDRLLYKCRIHSIELIEINSKGTGSICSQCGAEGKRLQDGFHCTECGYKSKASLNGAKNIEIKYNKKK